jgi:hypothetical protein
LRGGLEKSPLGVREYVCDEDGVGIYFITLLLDLSSSLSLSRSLSLCLHCLSELSAKKYIALEALLSPGRCLITEGVICYSIWGRGWEGVAAR